MLKSKINFYLLGKHTKLILTFLFITFLSTNLFAQVQEWVSRYNGPGNGSDGASSIAIDDSGNVYVTGGSEGDYLTIKYNSAGVQQWAQRYNGTGNSTDRASSITVDDSGNAYVTGYSMGTNNYDIVTIKYNTFGVQQWIQRYNEPVDYWNYAYASALDDSGNVYVTGMRGSIASGCNNVITIKYNSYGVQQWVQIWYKEYPGYYQIAEARSIAVRESGVYVTGTCLDSADYRIVTIKYSTGGTQQWSRIYYSSIGWEDKAFSIAIDGSGNAYVTGQSMRWWPIMNTEYITIKYNAGGSQKWVKLYNGPGNGNDCARSNVVDDSGNVYVTGSSPGIGTGNDYATIKYNTGGTQQWVQRYNGPGNGNDKATSIAVDNFGGIYVTGSSVGSGTESDYTTIKYNTNGVQQWISRYNGPGNGSDDASSIAVDGSANVYVTGSSTGIGTGNDIATIKFYSTISLNSFNLQSPSAGDTIISFPNSTTPITFSWNTSAIGASYKWIFGTSLPVRLITLPAGGSLLLVMTLGELDNILAGLGVTPGNKLIGSWDVWAFRSNPPQNDSLKAANGPRSITLKRGIPALTSFNLSSPPNGTQINTSLLNDTLVYMKWTCSGDWTTYKWKFGSPTIANPMLTFESNNSGYDSLFSIRNSSIDSIFASLGVLPGEVKVGEWAVWAYNGVDSLKSTQTYSLSFRRANLIVLFHDPFSTGTGKWIITTSGTFIWQIFSAPYPNAYLLPLTSVSPVFSADGYYCGNTLPSNVTATVANNINCIGYENISIEFDNDWNSYQYTTAWLEASYNGGSTWIPIISFGSDVRNTHEIKFLPGASNIPNLKVRFGTRQRRHTSWWVIDNVTIKGDLVTAVTKNEGQIPTDYALSQNYPNPFNPSTKIKFDIPKSSFVKLIVYDILGRKINTLVNEKLSAGRYEVDWPAPMGDGSSYPSGLYFYKLISDGFVDVKKMVLVK